MFLPETSDLPESDRSLIALCIYISCSLSILGAGFVVFSFGILRRMRTFRLKIICFLSLADLLAAFCWLWGAFGIHSHKSWNTATCIAQGFCLQIFVFSSGLWTSCFAYTNLRMSKGDERVESYEKFYHIISWGAPFALSSFGLFVTIFSPETSSISWCGNDQSRSVFHVVYIPLLVLLVYNISSYVVIWKRIRPSVESPRPYFQDELAREQIMQRHFRLYIIAYVLSIFPAFVNRVQNLFWPDSPLLALFVVQALTQPAQGFFNAVLYVFNHQLVKEYRHLCLCNRRVSRSFLHLNETDSIREPLTTPSKCVSSSIVDALRAFSPKASSRGHVQSAKLEARSDAIAVAVGNMQDQIKMLEDSLAIPQSPPMQSQIREAIQALRDAIAVKRKQLVLREMGRRW
eukprot:GILK01009861.1.p1 GENE.GILK01009861.1~~GILK01009861.1.p1  ORF type:complete len:403 (+),score=27.56 GILK01009861.1:48-1256(+)